MQLSRHNLKHIHSPGLELPGENIFDLPERILQFGTGVLLRALPDYFVDKANRQGIFNGRILIVKSTTAGDASVFKEQDGMYSLLVRGVENGNPVDQQIVCSAISRILSAATQWDELMAVAASPDLQIIISNTTEVGIQLVKESVFLRPPSSFPAKLLAFLYQRFKIFQGAAFAGMVIIPTELLPENGLKLKNILL